MSLERVILHAGLPKTGTSAIQDVLHQNAKALNAVGAFYPPSPDHATNPHPNQRFLIQELRNGPDLPVTKAAFSAAHERGARQIIFSIEGVTGHISKIRPDAALAFAALCGEAALEVIVVERDAQRWLASMYRQSLVNPYQHGRADCSPLELTYGTAMTFAEFAQIQAIRDLCDPQTIAARFKSLWPKVGLTFLPYDRDILPRFASHLGLGDLSQDSLARQSNIMPDDTYLEVLRQMNGRLSDSGETTLLKVLVSKAAGDTHAQLSQARAGTIVHRALWGTTLYRALSHVHFVDNAPLDLDAARLASARDSLKRAALRAILRAPEALT